MSGHTQRKLAALKKRLLEKIDELESYVTGERECGQD